METPALFIQYGAEYMRARYGWTYRHVAHAVGMKAGSTIANWAKGRNSPSADRITRFTELMDVVGKVGDVKLRAPRKPIGLDEDLAAAILPRVRVASNNTGGPPNPAAGRQETLLDVLDACRKDITRIQNRIKAKVDAAPALLRVGLEQALVKCDELDSLMRLD